MIPKRIVSEIQVNWVRRDGILMRVASTISERLEEVISVNAARGYALESWQYQSVPLVLSERVGEVEHRNDVYTETIIAVFLEA